jgi:hypothetical protein
MLGGVLVAAAAAATAAGLTVLPHSGGHQGSALRFGSLKEQQAFARDHLLGEPTDFVVAGPAKASPFALRVLL